MFKAAKRKEVARAYQCDTHHQIIRFAYSILKRKNQSMGSLTRDAAAALALRPADLLQVWASIEQRVAFLADSCTKP
jgi:hypothetical protein